MGNTMGNKIRKNMVNKLGIRWDYDVDLGRNTMGNTMGNKLEIRSGKRSGIRLGI